MRLSRSVLLIAGFFLVTACSLDEGGLCLVVAEAGCASFTGDDGSVNIPDADSSEGGQDGGTTADADSGNTDSGDASTDALADAGADADSGADADAAVVACGMSGTVVFDASMPCYKEGLYRSGNFLPAPDSSPDTATCQTGTCGNTPLGGDIEALWVQETQNTGLLTSTSAPSQYSARCTSYTAASPPSLSQLKSEIAKVTGWFTPVHSNVGTSYTLTAPSCAGSSVLYILLY